MRKATGPGPTLRGAALFYLQREQRLLRPKTKLVAELYKVNVGSLREAISWIREAEGWPPSRFPSRPRPEKKSPDEIDDADSRDHKE